MRHYKKDLRQNFEGNYKSSYPQLLTDIPVMGKPCGLESIYKYSLNYVYTTFKQVKQCNTVFVLTGKQLYIKIYTQYATELVLA